MSEENKLPCKVETKVNPDTQEILQTVEFCGEVTRTIMSLKDEQSRKALIHLGWTPPESPLTTAAVVALRDTMVKEIEETQFERRQLKRDLGEALDVIQKYLEQVGGSGPGPVCFMVKAHREAARFLSYHGRFLVHFDDRWTEGEWIEQP